LIIVYGIVLGNVGGYIIVDLIVLEETFLLFFANQQYVAGNIHTKVVFIFIRESRYTKDFIDNGEFFSLSFLSEKYRDALKYCGAHSGRGEDKWSKAGLTPATRHGIPYPDEANLVFLCRKMAAVPIEEASFTDKAIMHQWYGDHDMHTMYVGEIIEVAAR
jgi:flavin reductase (DIM6/NTAB) family NADH-FMN oxidoreductase RutF